MTPLAQIIRQHIAEAGPITVAEYMQLCLGHPEHGYYIRQDPLGASGDFTTAPEISQMFGELLGLFLAQCWLDQGAPAPFVLAELGPGRGTLMSDALRATRNVPGFHAASQVWLVETSPALRAVQAGLLGPDVNWCTTVQELPALPLFLIANEFFDALPIRQFQRSETGWHERLIGLQGEALTWGQSGAMKLDALDQAWPGAAPGMLVETCHAGRLAAAEIGRRLCAAGGQAVFADYGDWHGTGDTFQAMANHSFVDPLASPGQADLTAHVDFSALAASLAPANVWPLQMQGDFLRALGIVARAEKLGALPELRRLTDADQMGRLFKILVAGPGK